MKTSQRHQIKAPHCNGVLYLLGFSSAGAVESPYFQPIDMRKEANQQGYKTIFASMIKAFILGYVQGGTSADVSFFLKDDSNTYTFCATAPLTITTSDTYATVAASAATSVSTWCTANIGVAPDATEWIVSTAATTRSEQSLSLSVQTSTGAVGTQVSATQDALAFVDLSTITTASISGNAAVDLVVEVAPTNSATAGDWVIKGRSGNAQSLSLALALQSVQTVKGETVVYVPAGYYMKVRSTGITGTVTTAIPEARAVLL